MSRRTALARADGERPAGERPVAGAPATAVVWERLHLEGFGRHRDLRVAFPDGLGVWVAPNEAGKSTALLGLVAVLWGLPHVQDRDGFAWARFRPWGGGAQRGEVTLRADGRRFTVRRAFDTHAVRVVAHEPEGDRVVVETAHNPNARKEVTAYGPWLQATLGLTDAGLVLATFVVAQGDLGGPRHALDAGVQALVAGAGGGGWSGARARLEAALRERTKRLKALGAGFTRDGTADRALEEAEARVEGLEAAIAAGRTLADAFEGAQRAVRAAQEALGEARAERARWAATVAAQGAWTERRDAYARALRGVGERERAAALARERVEAAATARAAADRTHPALAAVGSGFEVRLGTWATASATLAEREGRLAGAVRDRAEAVGAAHDAVAAAIAAERAVPAASRDWSTWARPEEAAGRDPDAAAPPAGAAPTPAPAWADAVADVRRAIERWRTRLADVRAAREALLGVEAVLAPLAAFDAFDPDDVPAIRGYAASRDALAARVAVADAAHARAAARVAEQHARFGPVAPLEHDVRAALKAFVESVERPETGSAWRWLGAAASALAVAFGGPALAEALGRDLGPAWRWGTAAAAALAWLVGWTRWAGAGRARRAVARLARRGALAPAAAALGRSVDDDEVWIELGRRLQAFEAMGDDVARDEGELAAAADRAAVARADAEAFDAGWAEWRAALVARGAPSDVDLGAAYARYEDAVRERSVARERLRAALAALGASAPTAAAPAASAADAGPDGARALAWARFHAAVADGASVGEVEAWCARLGEATWARWLEEAASADALAVRRAAARSRRVAAEAEAGRVAAEHERAVQRDEAAVAEAAAANAGARDAVLAAWGDGGAAALAAWGDDPQRVRAAWGERRDALAAAAAAEGAAAAHLAAIGVEEAASLSAGVAAADDAARAARVDAAAALTAWRVLTSAHPDLPAVDPEASGVGAGDVRAAFDAARAALAVAQQEEESAQRRVLEAHEALARVQGGDPIDVAAAEVDRTAAMRDVARLRDERDALAIALRTLDGAVEDYRAAHAERLEHAATAAFERFSGVAGRRVVLDDAFAARVVAASGDAAVPAQLSQGARDQLAVALRLAVADLLAADVALPLVFDDPFLNWDEARSERLVGALRELARERQVVVLTHRAALGAWGAAVEVVGG